MVAAAKAERWMDWQELVSGIGDLQISRWSWLNGDEIGKEKMPIPKGLRTESRERPERIHKLVHTNRCMCIIALYTYVHTHYANTPPHTHIYLPTLPTLELAGRLTSGLCL